METLNTTTTTVTERARAPQLQDRTKAGRITDALELITATQQNAALMTRLATRGYDSARFQQGLDLHAAAQAAFNARQQAVGEQRRASAAFLQAQASARRAFTEFRMTARMLFPDPPTAAALGLDDAPPYDLEQFISAARAAYTNAQSEPMSSALAEYGLTPAVLTAHVQALAALVAAETAHRAAVKAAQQATQEREQALAALDGWVRRLRLTLGFVKRQPPTLIA